MDQSEDSLVNDTALRGNAIWKDKVMSPLNGRTPHENIIFISLIPESSVKALYCKTWNSKMRSLQGSEQNVKAGVEAEAQGKNTWLIRKALRSCPALA